MMSVHQRKILMQVWVWLLMVQQWTLFGLSVMHSASGCELALDFPTGTSTVHDLNWGLSRAPF